MFGSRRALLGVSVLFLFTHNSAFAESTTLSPAPLDPSRVVVEGSQVSVSFQSLLNSARSGDSFVLNPGVYRSNLIVPFGVHIHGSIDASREDVILDGSECTISEVKGCSVLAYERSVSGGEPLTASQLSKVTIEGGYGTYQEGASGRSGGGIYVKGGQLQVSDVELRENDAQYGGGIYVLTGTLSLDNVLLYNNRAQSGGGAKFDASEVEFLNVEAIENYATSSCGGLSFGGTVRGSGLRVIDNQTAGPGGGLCTQEPVVRADMDDVLIQGNECNSQSLGGGMKLGPAVGGKISNLRVLDNIGGTGGGISATYGWTLSDIEIAGNTATLFGGGISATFGIILDGGSIHDNVVLGGGFGGWGGGIHVFAANLDITSLRIEGNRADFGGGIYAVMGRLHLDGVLIAGNTASLTGGGIDALRGAGVMRNVTIAGNRAPSAAGIQLFSSGLRIESSILADNVSFGRGDNLYYGNTGGKPSRERPYFNHTLSYSEGLNNGLATHPYSGWKAELPRARGNLSKEPSFACVRGEECYLEADPYSLSEDSPAIDAGEPQAQRDDRDGSPNDMGAYGGPNGLELEE